MGRMRPTVFAAVRERDGHRCIAGCGDQDTLIPGHRANRGMGGHKGSERSSNVVTMCAWLNDQVESNADRAAEARRYGWKISRYEDPAVVPVYDAVLEQWFLLDDEFGRLEVPEPTERG